MSFVVGEIAAKLTADDKQFVAKLREAEKQGKDTSLVIASEFKKIGESMQKTGGMMTTRLTLPLVGFGALALRTAGNFESSMNRVAAISQATQGELQDLEDQARELGSTTQFSASQAADGMSFLAMAGFEVKEIMSAMPSVLNLAAAAQLDMAQSADIASNIMSGFGMDAGELAGAVDVLAKSFTSSNTDLSQLGEAMKLVGPVASGFGVQFEETAAAVGFLSDAGLQASMAGTGLRRVITTIAKEADKLGVSAYDSAGNLRPLADLLEDIEKTGLSSARAMEIFGDRGGPAMQVLLSRGSGALREMTGELNNAGGTAQRIADQQMEGLNGALKELNSAFEELQLAISDAGLIDFATDSVRAITSITRTLGELHPAILTTGTVIAGLTATAGPAIWMLGSFTKNAAVLTTTVKGSTTAVKALNAVMIASPYIAVAAAITAIGIAAWSSEKSIRDLNRAVEDALKLDINSQSLEQVNGLIAEFEGKIEDLRSSPDYFGIESRRIAGMEKELEKLIQRRDELAAKKLDEFITERDRQNAEDTAEATQRLSTAINELKPAVEAIPPFDEIFTPEELADAARELDLIRMGVAGIVSEMDSDTDFTHRMFPPGSLGDLQERMQLLREQMQFAFDPEVQARLREEMELTQAQMDAITGSTKQASAGGQEFGNIMGNALSQAVLHGNNLQDVLKNLIKQFASRAFVTGITALVTGGTSLAGGSFLGSVFGGLFHSGGVVPGSGERTIKAMGGEMVLTRSQQKALGGMVNQSAPSINPSQMQRAFSAALSAHTSKLGPDEVFVLTQKGRGGF